MDPHTGAGVGSAAKLAEKASCSSHAYSFRLDAVGCGGRYLFVVEGLRRGVPASQWLGVAIKKKKAVAENAWDEETEHGVTYIGLGLGERGKRGSPGAQGKKRAGCRGHGGFDCDGGRGGVGLGCHLATQPASLLSPRN